MTIADLYHYPTQHFRYHQRQLTLTGPDHLRGGAGPAAAR
jgi:hypothetical protein